jgi:hypothetical protein
MPSTALGSHVRQLREAGLLSKTGRGITGAKMTPMDGAKLLIAALTSQNIKDGVDNLNAYGALRTNKAWLLETMPLPEVVTLPTNHTFLDALTGFISAGVSGSLQAAVQSIQGGEGVDLATAYGPPVRLQFSTRGPVKRARIAFESFWFDHEGEMELDDDDACDYYVAELSGVGNLPKVEVGKLAYADLSYEFGFTHRTIQQIADLIRQ